VTSVLIYFRLLIFHRIFLSQYDITLRRLRKAAKFCGFNRRQSFGAATSPENLGLAENKVFRAIRGCQDIGVAVADVTQDHGLEYAFTIYPSDESRRLVLCLVKPVSEWALGIIISTLELQVGYEVRGTPWPGVSSGLRPAGGSCGNAKCMITSVLAIIRLLPAIEALPQLEWNRISQVREYVDVWTLDPRRGWWAGHLCQRIRGWLFLLFLTELHVLSMLASTNPPTRDFSWALSSDITTSEVAASIRRRVETPSPSHLKALDHYFSSFSFQCKLQYFLETKIQI